MNSLDDDDLCLISLSILFKTILRWWRGDNERLSWSTIQSWAKLRLSRDKNIGPRDSKSEVIIIIIIIINNGFLINMQVQGQHPHQWAPLPSSWLAACMADLTPDLQVCLSWGSIAESHSLQSLSNSYFHDIFGLPGLCFPSTYRSKAVLTAPLEHSTFQWSLLSFGMRLRSLMPSRTSSSLDLVVTMSCGLTLQICLIIAMSFCCRRWRFGFVNGQVPLARSIVPRTQDLYMWLLVLKERWWEERTGSRSLNFFQAVFTCVVVESSQPPAAESMSPR